MPDVQGPALGALPDLEGDRYELAARIGVGGMAEVYRAYDHQRERWCAVKVLLQKYRSDHRIRTRFEIEAQTMLRLSHRNVIDVYDIHITGEVPFMAMELAEGGSLMDWVEAHGAMPARLACDLAIQLCKGLGAAHALEVVHRDVKPHNVLLNHRGVCKLTDFGIAQTAHDAGLTEPNRQMGTLAYMAPEQKDHSRDTDVRTDVYGVGATLFTLLTGRSTVDLFIAEREPDLLEGVPEVLKPVLVRAVRFRPEDRWASVREFAKELYTERSMLPDDPSSTPDLVDRDRLTIPEHELSDGDSEATDQSWWFDQREPTPGPAPARTPAPPLFRTPAPAQGRAPTTAMPARQAPPTPRPPRPSPTLRTVEPAFKRMLTPPPMPMVVPRTPWMRWTALVLLAVLLVQAVVLSIGGLQVASAHRAADQARALWLGALATELAVVDELHDLGADRDALTALYEAQRAAEGAPQDAAAARYQDRVNEEVRTRTANPPPRKQVAAQSAKERALRMGAALDEHRYARRAWADTARAFPGSAAVGIGLASAPATP